MFRGMNLAPGWPHLIIWKNMQYAFTEHLQERSGYKATHSSRRQVLESSQNSAKICAVGVQPVSAVWRKPGACSAWLSLETTFFTLLFRLPNYKNLTAQTANIAQLRQGQIQQKPNTQARSTSSRTRHVQAFTTFRGKEERPRRPGL